MSSLVAPDKPSDKEYSQLVEKLSEHSAPAPSEIVEQFKFHTKFQNPGESVTSYLSELHSIAKRCNFEGSLETMLRDHIVYGINNAVIQCRLSEKDLMYKKALEIAQGMESAGQNVKELTSHPADTRPTAPVHHVTTFKQVVCYRCGKPGHYAPTCNHKETVCTKCGKVGHLQKVCRSKKTTLTKPTEQPLSKNSTEKSGSKKGVLTKKLMSMNCLMLPHLEKSRPGMSMLT